MTVKCIKIHDKAYIVDVFLAKTQTINELAMTYGRSRRTIVRVIEEAGINAGVKHRTPKEKQAEQYVFPGLAFPTHPIIPLYQPQPKPWYRKVLDFVGLSV